MGAVDKRLDAALGEGRDDPLDREDESGRAGDVADDGKPRSLGDGAEERIDDDVRACHRERDPGDVEAGSIPLRHMAEDVDHGVVLVVVGQQLVARREAERAHDRIDGARRVRHEGEVVGIGADERGEGDPRAGEKGRQVAGEELDGLRLHPVLPCSLGLEDGPRTGSERPVVEEGDRGIERPMPGQLRRHRPIMTGTLGPWVPWTRWTRSSSC